MPAPDQSGPHPAWVSLAPRPLRQCPPAAPTLYSGPWPCVRSGARPRNSPGPLTVGTQLGPRPGFIDGFPAGWSLLQHRRPRPCPRELGLRAGTVQYTTLHFSTLQKGPSKTLQSITVQPITLQYITVQPITLQYITVQCSRVHHCT